jgi:hypothetical protein
LIEQWRALHGSPQTPGKTDLVHGYPHRVWRDASGRDVIEEYSITGLGHGTPLDTRGSRHGEQAAPFMLEAGISSTYLIARFWSVVPDQADYSRSSASTAPRRAEPRPKPAEATWSRQAGVQETIENALRSAGLMK